MTRWAHWTTRFAERAAGYVTPCSEWTGATTNGYGVVRVAGVLRRVTNVAWEQAYGPIPVGYEVCHYCNNPPCARLDHLYLATHRKNMEDAGRDGLLGPKRPARGTDHAAARLTEADVLAIRASTESQRATARRYGVSQASVYNIVNRKTWRHT